MLKKLLATLLRHASSDEPAEHQAAKASPADIRLSPMVPLLPPAPDNDDLMAGLHKEVERALRASGHL